MAALRGTAVLVVGGAGGLGRALVSRLQQRAGHALSVVSIDLDENVTADRSIRLPPSDSFSPDTESEIAERVRTLVSGGPGVSAVLCAAGGWAGGSLCDRDKVTGGGARAVEALHEMMDRNLRSAVLSAFLAGQLLMPSGLLMFTGAQACLEPCPSMIGYALAKSATHYLAQSMAADEHFPKGATSLAILPTVLDTPANREAMPNEDRSVWTPLSAVADKCVEWVSDPDSRPASGSLVRVNTSQAEGTVWSL